MKHNCSNAIKRLGVITVSGKIIPKILCLFGYHTPVTWYNNAWRDGANRPHSYCRYCFKSFPMFIRNNKKMILGKTRFRENH